MKPRRMRIDFKGAPVHWSRQPEFATLTNSGSAFASAFEPYLNKVMARVRDTLPVHQARVKHDIGLFIAQEGHHYRVHNSFNKELYAVYPRLREFETTLSTKLNRRLDARSLRFNTAWCAAFENLACYMAKFIFTKALPLYEGGDIRGTTLFLWHAAEEFEHRSACSDALRAISSNYFLRVFGFVYFMIEVLTFDKKIKAYMLEIDRQSMTPADRAASIRFEKAYNRQYAAYVFPRMLRIFLPFYDPAKQRAPQALHDALDDYEQIALRPEPVAG